MNLRTPIAKVRGLGSAKHGTEHYLAINISSIALAGLGLWVFIGFLGVVGEGRDAVLGWMAHPLNAVLIVSFLYNTFYHMMLGFQVIIEDYVHTEWLKMVCLMTLRFVCIYCGLISVLSTLKIVFQY